MKYVFSFTRRIKSSIQKIHVVDRFLILFMAILLAQCAYNLFSNEANTQESNHIDIVVRTSAAAIFGYFVSANFIRDSSAAKEPDLLPEKNKGTDKKIVQPSSPVAVSQWEPQPPEPESDRFLAVSDSANPSAPVPLPEIQRAETQGASDPNAAHSCNYLQIVVVSAVGLSALFTMLVFRNFFDMTPAAAGTLSQLRDFVSGCVGFLIGCETSSKNL